jgi:hypothetical protein
LAFFNHISYAEGRKVSRFRLLGRKSDITLAKYMFSWLVSECSRLSDIEAKGRGHIYVASYCHGFVKGIADQLSISRRDISKDATSAALVKLDARGA